MVAQVALTHRIGARSAMENIGCGTPFTAHRAYEVGLVQAIAGAANLLRCTRDWLIQASRGNGTHAYGRPLLYQLGEMDYDTALTIALENLNLMFPDRS